MMSLADQIEKALADLDVLLNEANDEITRDDLPDEWEDDLMEADDASQHAVIEMGSCGAFNEHWIITEKMLRRIDAWDEEQDKAFEAKAKTP